MPDKPFPKSEGEIEIFLENLNDKLPGYAATFGLGPPDLGRLDEAAQNFDYLRNMANQVNDSKEAFFDYKNTMMYGPEGPLVVPTFPTIALPVAGDPGIVPYVKNLIKRIKANPNYTEQIGEDLGLVVDNPEQPDFGDIVPELRLKAIEDGNVEIKFSKQGLDAMRIDWRVKDTTEWQSAGVFTTSPAIHSHPSADGKPEAREYRGRLLKKNVAVSQYSAIYTVVTNP